MGLDLTVSLILSTSRLCSLNQSVLDLRRLTQSVRRGSHRTEPQALSQWPYGLNRRDEL